MVHSGKNSPASCVRLNSDGLPRHAHVKNTAGVGAPVLIWPKQVHAIAQQLLQAPWHAALATIHGLLTNKPTVQCTRRCHVQAPMLPHLLSNTLQYSRPTTWGWCSTPHDLLTALTIYALSAGGGGGLYHAHGGYCTSLTSLGELHGGHYSMQRSRLGQPYARQRPLPMRDEASLLPRCRLACSAPLS